ncbi:hypothetical protein [Bifidobacterium avesanii]|uniref:CTP synthase n=1 Tax=Bifidobacterium avesanii TaxID=1798157 RepID=A0A7K3THZ5_9BIFI|nr:hypothetical protein [Bifidobacterium avesanii]NEG78250.1 hypothetical protein [Bifidobacterium avesanii]
MNHDQRLNELLEQAERAGMCLRARNADGRRVLRYRAERRQLIAVRPDLFARPAYWSALPYAERILHILRTVAAAHPDRVLAQVSAAAVWGLSETYRLHDRVHFATDLRSHSRDHGYFTFHHVPGLTVAVRDGLRITTLVQTVFDCARMMSFPQALAIGDAAMRLHRLTDDEFGSFLDDHRGFKGITNARKVARYMDARSDNGGESIVRALLIEWGYAVPLLQQWITDPVRGRRYRVDFLWILPNGDMIVLELDGREKYANPVMLGDGDGVDALLAEKEREDNIRLHDGIRFVRTTFLECEREPATVRFKLDRAGVPRIR